jgi:multiple sugar transport system ATP-binding protein
MTTVTFDKASRTYEGGTRPAVDQLDLQVADGEFLVLVGPSGCGKSTCLRMLAGLEPVDAGHIRIGDRDVTDVDPSDRDIAMVFQTYALYPHMTVAANMGFALKIGGVSKDEITTRVAEAAKVLERRLGVTTLYVTHDQVEAMTMGDRVAVLKDGVLQQVDSPRAMYERPSNVFVAGFIGSPAMNLFEVEVGGDGVVRLGNFSLETPRGAQGGVTVGVRPEDLRLVGADEGIPATVELLEELGADAFLHATVRGSDGSQILVARVDPKNPPGKGTEVTLAPTTEHLHWFSTGTGERLSGT